MGKGDKERMEKKVNRERRESEKERRELAQAHAGEIVEDSGVLGTPRLMPQMVSVRLDGKLAMELWDAAERRGVTLSDLLREGARWVVQDAYESAQPRMSSYKITGAKGAPPIAASGGAYAIH